MDIETETAPLGNVVTDKAAEIVCAWLARHGLELIETVESGPKHEWNCGMEIGPVPGKFVCMNKMFPSWDWVGSRRTLDKAWLTIASWLFSESIDGPTWIQTTVESRPSLGRVVFRRKKFLIPKLTFSGLEEFVLKAAVLPDFREIS